MTSIRAEATPLPVDRLRVWDLPTRLFHWSLVGLLLVSWFTGEEEGAAALVHRLSGEAIAGLVVFRVIWGFVGGERARFADFLRGPGAVGRHLAHLLRGKADPAVGHNPLGGLSVLVLLLAVCAVVTTGLFSAGEEGPGGPLAGLLGWELSELHEPAFRVLEALVVLHLVGVAVTSLAERQNLVAAMISGSKRRRPDTHVAHARRASAGALLVAVVLGAAASGVLMSLPHPSAGAQEEEAGPSSIGEAKDRESGNDG
ncbi:cytochrome b/b6 domain-containing protein [uncultured Phenylobacterium sp.]|uniref:cytochrome b/b6 domain-containing protein n=1 Tax=uncultured Phenylobacterium sp. TaxID=349273 RepID=UPI0025F0B180|nr:cytochrome b/b6 domain-containing protein [uncultured Phenylobacterium sp.]